MLLNPDAFVQAEIDRRFELAGASQWHRSAPATPKRRILRDLAGRRLRLFRRALPAGAGPVPTTAVAFR